MACGSTDPEGQKVSSLKRREKGMLKEKSQSLDTVWWNDHDQQFWVSGGRRWWLIDLDCKRSPSLWQGEPWESSGGWEPADKKQSLPKSVQTGPAEAPLRQQGPQSQDKTMLVGPSLLVYASWLFCTCATSVTQRGHPAALLLQRKGWSSGKPGEEVVGFVQKAFSSIIKTSRDAESKPGPQLFSWELPAQVMDHR